jgi:hypothetical protein
MMMKSAAILIGLFAAGLAMQSSDAAAKKCMPIKVAATGFGHTEGVATTLAWEAWETGVERRVDNEKFHDSDNVGSPSVDCSMNKSGRDAGRGVLASSSGHPASAWVCQVSGTPCDSK